MKCILCHNAEATVPDRNTCSPRKRVCSECHGARLQGDLVRIMKKPGPGWGPPHKETPECQSTGCQPENGDDMRRQQASNIKAIVQALVLAHLAIQEALLRHFLWGEGVETPVGLLGRSPVADIAADDGDDKTIEFCRNRFNNLASFPSAPFVPENAVETGSPKGKP